MSKGLLQNDRFEDWSGGFPTVWSRLATANVTYHQLSKTDPLVHPQRTVFPTSTKKSDRDYILRGGLSGLRLEFAAAAAADGWIIRSHAAAAKGMSVVPGQRYALMVTARNSVDLNHLRCQVIGLLGTTDTLYLIPDTEATHVDTATLYMPGRGGFTWTTSVTNITWRMRSQWQAVGLQIPIPLGIDSIAVRLSNGSAAAQVIDLGEVLLLERSYKVGGVG